VRLIPIIILLIFILPAIGFLLLVGKLFSKGKAAAWEGVVIDRGHVVKEKIKKDGAFKRKKQEDFYHIKVKLDNGEVHAIAVTPEMYEEIQVGDRLRKEKGELWPKKV